MRTCERCGRPIGKSTTEEGTCYFAANATECFEVGYAMWRARAEKAEGDLAEAVEVLDDMANRFRRKALD